MNSLSLFKVLEKVNVDCKNYGDKWVNKDRITAMQKLLKNSEYSQINNGEDERMLALLYAKSKPTQDKEYVVISSHIDTVMRKFFTERMDNGQIKGTFDNSITNAATIHNMLQGNFADNVIIAFGR